MNAVNKFIKHLIKKGIFPFEEIIADGESHLVTDGNTGRQFTYAIYEKEFRLIEITRKAA